MISNKEAENNFKIEEQVLSMLMNDSNAVEEGVLKLEPKDFFDEGHRAIFNAIMTLATSGKGADSYTVTEYIKTNSSTQFPKYEDVIGDVDLLYSSSARISEYIDIIKNNSIKRQLDKFSAEIIASSIDYNTFNDSMEQYYRRFGEIVASKKIGKFNDIKAGIKQFLERINVFNSSNETLTGTPSGFREIDDITSGWQNGNLIVLAARPGMGKTTFALNCLLYAAKYWKAKDIQDENVEKLSVVLMFSLEMTHVELVQRLIASESLVNISLSRKQELSKIQSAALGQAVDVLSDLPIKIDDTPMLTINEIQSKIKQVSATNTIKLVVVDYLQLIKGPKSNSQNNREREVAEVSRTLKAIAKSYNTPVIALAQLSRKIEERQPMGNRHQPPYSSEPKLSDLRESGSIEQDADIVSFLWNEPTDGAETTSSDDVIVKFIIAKHRGGQTKSFKLNFKKSLSSFTTEIGG